ncbi:hypothetical protein [Allobaculum sp. Allo2]|nr:hypothetical protein [Allobaculum sp. Allo2]UNT94008.1 hypothetical protein KWG61_04920 [Allobaculum sp. Allo2]
MTSAHFYLQKLTLQPLAGKLQRLFDAAKPAGGKNVGKTPGTRVKI